MAPPRPWSAIPIKDLEEPLLPLPPEFLRLEPHPYQLLGAPYGPGACPFRLRRGIVSRLRAAQRALETSAPGLRLAIFDAWRPVEVQAFMVDHAVTSTCQERGVDPGLPSPARQTITAEVARFWAPPSLDPATPPPHSTGAAVDLTLADAGGLPLDLGSPIDAIGVVSEPDHFATDAATDPQGDAASWHGRRQLLAQVMGSAGFHRHPNEWWHFSHGDQLWAWLEGVEVACYGRYLGGEPGSS